MKKPEAGINFKWQAAQKRLMVLAPYAPGALLLFLGAVVLVYPEAFRIAVGIFFVAAGFLIVHATRIVRRVLRGLQAHVEVYAEEEISEDPSSLSVLPESMRQWVN